MTLPSRTSAPRAQSSQDVEFLRRVADAADAGHEDHAHRPEPRHHLRVVAGAAREARVLEREGIRRTLDGGHHRRGGGRPGVAADGFDRDRRLRARGDLLCAAADDVGQRLQRVRRQVAQLDAGLDAPGDDVGGVRRHVEAADRADLPAREPRHLLSNGEHQLGAAAPARPGDRPSASSRRDSRRRRSRPGTSRSRRCPRRRRSARAGGPGSRPARCEARDRRGTTARGAPRQSGPGRRRCAAPRRLDEVRSTPGPSRRRPAGRRPRASR